MLSNIVQDFLLRQLCLFLQLLNSVQKLISLDFNVLFVSCFGNLNIVWAFQEQIKDKKILDNIAQHLKSKNDVNRPD